MRIVEQLVRAHDRRIRDAGGFELGRQFCAAVVAQDCAQLIEQLRTHRHARGIADVLGLVEKLRVLQHLAQRHELLVADGADKQLLVAGQREDVIHAPRRHARRHRRRRLAGHCKLLHMLRGEEHAVLEQRALDLLAAPGAVALAQRGQHADGAEHAAHDVVDRGARAQRTPAWAGHVGQAAHHLHHLVQRQPVLVRAGQEALVRDVDQVRVVARQRGVVQPQLLHQAGPEVLQQHVALARQLGRGGAPFLGGDVQHHALLVAVEGAEEADAQARQVARLVAAGRPYLDHLGAEVGQDHAAGGAHHHMREFDHADAGQRQGVSVVLGHLASQAAAPACWAGKVLGRPARHSVPCRVSSLSQPATSSRSASRRPISMPVSMPMLPSM